MYSYVFRHCLKTCLSTYLFVPLLPGYLPFLELESTEGIPTLQLPTEDDGTSDAIPIPIDFPLGDSIQTEIYVSAHNVYS